MNEKVTHFQRAGEFTLLILFFIYIYYWDNSGGTVPAVSSICLITKLYDHGATNG